MKNLQTLIFGFLCIMLAFSCEAPGEPEVDMEAVESEIQAMEDAYAEASNKKDAEAQVAYYAEDAVSLPPNAVAVEGREAILARTKKEMAEEKGEGTIRFEMVDLWASGDLAVEHGRWIFTTADGEERTGKFVTVFEKRDGKYVAVRDIWNSDAEYDDDMEDHMDDMEDDMEDAAEGDDM